MRILGIETSCDETAAAVVDDGTVVLSNVISSASSRYTDLKGVIPEDAARCQMECIIPVIQQALKEANTVPSELSAIAVTRAPGLLGSLLVGTSAARMLSLSWNVPVIGVHHTLGHLTSVWPGSENDPQFPSITLSVSGGHTDLWLRSSHTKGILLGRTRDDAVGEAFDKGASLLGLPYPGGPAIGKAAASGDMTAFSFPKPLSSEDTLDFSFSGLKTSLRYLLRDRKLEISQPDFPLQDLCAAYEHSLCMHLVDRLEKAIEANPQVREVHVVGGVSANTHLRVLVTDLLTPKDITVRFPAAFGYCTDNAVMIASAGHALIREKPELLGSPFLTEATANLDEVLSA